MASSINGPQTFHIHFTFFFSRTRRTLRYKACRIRVPPCGTASSSVAASSRRPVQPNAGRHEEAAT